MVRLNRATGFMSRLAGQRSYMSGIDVRSLTASDRPSVADEALYRSCEVVVIKRDFYPLLGWQ